MTLYTPEFTTYAHNEETLTTAIQNGATHVILEDSKVSVRSYSNDFDTPHFDKLTALSDAARKLNPNIILSLNIDLLAHHHHFNAITQAIKTAKKANIQRIRVQDPSLSLLIQEHYPQAQLHLSQETGNHNSKSITYYHTKFNRQCLNNEIPIPDLTTILPQINHQAELLVHGPILIQYSPRRFIQGYLETHTSTNQDTEENHNIHIKSAQDQDYPKRYFPFYDNSHGHFMYLYFDRCLIKHIPDLAILNLESWLIDARGESKDYLIQALTHYKTQLNRYQENPESWAHQKPTLEALEKTASRPLRPGFFKMNKTDQNHIKSRVLPEELSDKIHIGTVIDAIKQHWLTIQFLEDYDSQSNITFYTPEKKLITLKTPQLYDIWGNPIQSASAGSCAKTKWVKGISSKSKLFS